MKRVSFAFLSMVLALPRAAVAQADARVSDMPYSGAPCTASGGIPPSPQQISSFNHFDMVLRSAVKRQDAVALAFLVRFPLRVNTAKGTLLIPDAASLSGHFAEIFAAGVREKVLATVPDDFYCRYDEGLGYKEGVLWVSTDGHRFGVDAVNTSDTPAKPALPKLLYTCETKTHRIAVEEGNDGTYRYRSWNTPREVTEPPDVDLSDGKVEIDGTGVCAVPVYTFRKGDVVYEVGNGLGCTDGKEPARATGQLTVSVTGKQVSQSWCF